MFAGVAATDTCLLAYCDMKPRPILPDLHIVAGVSTWKSI